MKTRLKVGTGIVASLALGSWWMASNNPAALGYQVAIAIRDSDDNALVENLLARGADPNYRIVDGESGLKDKGVALLAGAQATNEDEGIPLLFIACDRNKGQIVSSLLKHGANPNIECYLGWTPLMAAVRGANADVVRLLLAHGANPNCSGPGNNAPLKLAVEFKKPNLIPLLKQAGAKEEARVNTP